MVREAAPVPTAAAESVGGPTAAAVQAVLEQASDALIVIDGNSGRIVGVSQQAEALYGYSRAEFFALPPGWDPRTEEERAADPELFARAAAGAPLANRPRWHRRKDGTLVPVEASMMRLTYEGAAILVVTVRDVSERLAAEAELAARLAEVEALLDLSTLLGTADDLQSVLERIVEGVARCLGVVGGLLLLPEGDALVCARLLRDGRWLDASLCLPVDASIAGLVYRTGATAIVPDAFADPRAHRESVMRLGLRSFLYAAVPGRDGAALAVLGVHGRPTERPFTERDARLLEAAARHAGAALERAHLLAEARERARDGERLLAGTAALNAATLPEDVVRAVGEHAAALCDAEIASVGLCRGGTVAIEQLCRAGVWCPVDYQPPAAGSSIAEVIATGRPDRCNDLAANPDGDTPLAAALALRNQLTVPLVGTAGGVLGVVALFNKRAGQPFTATDEMLTAVLASRAAVALERAASREELAETVAALRHSEDTRRLMMEQLPLLVWTTDRDQRLTSCQGAGLATIDLTEAALIGHTIAELTKQNGQGPDAVTAHALALRGESARYELRLAGRELELRVDPLRGPEGSITGCLGLAVDVTDRRQTEAALHHAREHLHAVISNAPLVLVALDPDGRVTLVEGQALGALGISPGAITGLHFSQVYRDAPLVQAAYRRALAGESVTARFQFRGQDYDAYLAPRYADDGSPAGAIAIALDVTERARVERELTRQTFYDRLTGLPNRALFMERLVDAQSRAGRDHAPPSVILVDVDRFKVFNDSLGLGVGDELLTAIGLRLAHALRPGDTLARFGGDEFIVLLAEAGQAAAVAVAERLLNALRLPFTLDGQEAFVTASAGIAVGTVDGSAEGLLRDVDVALHRAKAAGRNRALVFQPSMSASAVDRLLLETDLQRALEREELRVYYQPQQELATGMVAGMEALVRWQHPERGLVPPAEFIPLAEETGLIVPIGQWVLREACRQGRAWAALLPPGQPFVMSVNLSAGQFSQPDLVAMVAQVLAETGLAPERLCLEVTESVLMEDVPAAAAILRELAGLGVTLAIDDFGTGYSSLSYLRDFPMHVLKIDRSFIWRMREDESAVKIVQAIAGLGHALEMLVTAEGIETERELTQALAVGCDAGQGYLFARPAPASELTPLVLRAAEDGRVYMLAAS